MADSTPPATSELIQFVCAANQSTLEQLRTVAAVYSREKWVVAQNERTLEGKLFVEWWADGDVHRIRSYLQDPDTGEKTGHRDLLLQKDRKYLLRGYDWTSGPPVELGDHSVVGSIHVRSNGSLHVNPRADLLFDVQSRPAVKSLSELVRDSPAPVQIKSIGAANGELWQIKVTTPDDDGRAMEIIVDPAANYLVRTVVRNPTEQEAARFDYPTVTFSVERFDEVAPGVLFPMVVRSHSSPSENGEYFEYILEVSSLRVNQAVDEGMFEVSFPTNVAVKDHVANVTYVWGDGEAAYTIRSMQEDEALGRELLGHSSRTQSAQQNARRRPGAVFWTVNAIVCALIASVLVWKKRMRAKHG